ncbi:MAG: hypothetical protein DI533_21100 [Cereibacter sphaeroides]|uniref:Uncharacterized protein n=1 Tax=Cereibacter sphaeroides TaxID=1063 RepID=A0A2W5S1A9_CERSP|nr:MAG: hypothetical protein DI533_21100 [Cereibacter sphaeroides]
MERIQSAISKARAAREGKAPDEAGPSTTPPPPAKAVAAPVTPATTQDENWAALPEFVALPRVLSGNRIVTQMTGPAATAFDVIRTRLLQQMRANGWKRLAITSPGPSCGKTMTCLNLAFSLARQPDLRTIVIEADLRRPSIAKVLDMKIRQQVSNTLEGKADPAAHLARVGGLDLAIGTNHGAVRNPAELLQSATAEAALNAIEERFAPDLMIFDLPPTHVGDDVMAFMHRVDCVLIVAAAGTTTIDEVDHCERELAAQTNVLGVVLNKCRYLERRHSYNYY